MINTTRLRQIVGWLAIALPWLVLLLSLANGQGVPDSISATWWQWQFNQTPFMIILGSASVLLLCYGGYEKIDDIICTITGIFGFVICLFPCAYSDTQPVGLFAFLGMTEAACSWFHNIGAAAFFALLAFNSMFLFTKTSGIMTPNKKKRNIIFRVCAVGMLASFILFLPIPLFEHHGVTWFAEAIALAFFGISWLTKADCYPWLFCDKK